VRLSFFIPPASGAKGTPSRRTAAVARHKKVANEGEVCRCKRKSAFASGLRGTGFSLCASALPFVECRACLPQAGLDAALPLPEDLGAASPETPEGRCSYPTSRRMAQTSAELFRVPHARFVSVGLFPQSQLARPACANVGTERLPRRAVNPQPLALAYSKPCTTIFPCVRNEIASVAKR